MTPYTTVLRVRKEAGFMGNPDILDGDIETYLLQAHSVVVSYVAAAYYLDQLQTSYPSFTGSQAEGYLARAEELIAAGYLLSREYGTESQNTDKEGKKKIDEGEAMLRMLTDPKDPRRLIDVNGSEFNRIPPTVSGGIVATGAEPGENQFAVRMKF